MGQTTAGKEKRQRERNDQVSAVTSAANQEMQNQLAQGNTTGTSSPVQIGDKTNWKSIWGGTGKWAAVNTSGELWMCGANNVGQLGVGDTTNRSSPVQVGSETDWAQVVGGKYDHTLAIRIVE